MRRHDYAASDRRPVVLAPRILKTLAAALPILLALGGGCGDASDRAAPSEPATFAGDATPGGALVVTHGGVGSPPEWSAACGAAAAEGLASGSDATALDIAVAAVVALEDEPRFNAGTGANIRLDGHTIQMDAAVMTSDGEFAAVAAIERVRNPILVAREVLATPHRLLVGEGATRFAHRRGFADEVPISEEAIEKNRERVAKLLAGEAEGGYDTFDWRGAWNYPGPPPAETAKPTRRDPRDEREGGGSNGGDFDDGRSPGGKDEAADSRRGGVEGVDTVGAVARADDGSFAAALSTGGTSLTLYGRVGDVPIYACGCYAGPAGAVACTGFGEEIIRHAMARTVYEAMAAGRSAREALRAGVAAFGDEYSLGLIAVGRDDWGVAANREMAWGRAER